MPISKNSQANVTDAEARTRAAPGKAGWLFEVSTSLPVSASEEDLTSGSNSFHSFYSNVDMFFTMVSQSGQTLTSNDVTGSGPSPRAGLFYKLNANTPEEYVIDPKRPFLRTYASSSTALGELSVQKSGVV